jgi:hypothetical protein
MDLTLLETLKDKLVHATDFSDLWRYFLDHFGEDPGFIALGDRSRDPFLEAILSQLGSRMFSGRVTLTDLLLSRLADHHFTHGGLLLNGHLANVLYIR